MPVRFTAWDLGNKVDASKGGCEGSLAQDYFHPFLHEPQSGEMPRITSTTESSTVHQLLALGGSGNRDDQACRRPG